VRRFGSLGLVCVSTGSCGNRRRVVVAGCVDFRGRGMRVNAVLRLANYLMHQTVACGARC
jgi:hypothetical protein